MPGLAEPAPRDGSDTVAGLRYTSDASPGIRRVRRGAGFGYRSPTGAWIRDEATLRRIRSLAIPPAYTDVWICADANGHMQATGRDARGRKQYRYHARFRAERESSKFCRLVEFGSALGRIRRHVAGCLGGRRPSGPDHDTVLAAMVRILDTVFLRVGNGEYMRSNRSYGLTTLRPHHVGVQGSRIRLRFRGKGGRTQMHQLSDPAVARVIRRCQQLPGQELFQFIDDDHRPHSVGSADVNDFLASITGERFTAKDFRTWHGSVQALALLRRARSRPDPAPSASSIVQEVARRLGNTATVCRKFYIHPQVLRLIESPQPLPPLVAPRRAGLSADECRLLHLLEQA